jgi:hypothetical protein
VRLEDQLVEAVEQGPVLGGDGVDVIPYGVVHPSIIAPARGHRLGAGGLVA